MVQNSQTETPSSAVPEWLCPPADAGPAPGLPEVLGMLGHDLRAPLNGILGFLELLERTALDSEQRDCLTTARACGVELKETLDGILAGLEADAGRLPLHAEWHDVRGFLATVARTFELQAAQHGITFACEVNPSLPPLWYFDRIKLRQVLTNLVTNALKFTRPGGAVWLDAGLGPLSTADAGPRLELRVRDSGVGIRTADLTRVFAPFERGRSPGGNGPARPGHGLGLAIVHRLTAALNGTVELRSAEGHGTEVRLRFAWPSRGAG